MWHVCVCTQGVAHFVEHVTFLGSKKRENLLGTGARANAYTDFHHTVFHVHAPIINGVTGQQMLPQVGTRMHASQPCAWRLCRTNHVKPHSAASTG